MVIILLDGVAFIPQGNVSPSQWGITIENGNDRNTIPSSQIKWIYENPDLDKEKAFMLAMSAKNAPLIADVKDKTNQQILQGLK